MLQRILLAAAFCGLMMQSCSYFYKHAGRPAGKAYPPVPELEEEEEEEAEEAAEYELLRRSADGEPIRMERYHSALRRMQAMRRYSTRVRRLLTEGRKVKSAEWSQLGPGNFGGRTRTLLIHPQQPEILYAGAVAGGIWRSTNGGAEWSPLDDFLPFLSVSSLVMDPRNSQVIYAGTGEAFLNGDGLRGGGIYRTTNGGDTWTLLPATAHEDFVFVQKVAVSGNDGRRIYAATNAGLMMTRDGGSSWTRVVDRRAPNTGCHDVVMRTDVLEDSVIAACGVSRSALIGATNRNLFGTTLDLQSPGAIYRNPDAGGSGEWSIVLTDPNLARTSLAIAPSDQNVVYALASSNRDGEYRDALLALYRSADGGSTWQARVRNTDSVKLNTLLLTNAYIAQCTGSTPNSQGSYDNVIAVDPMDANRVWVGGIDLMRSDDGGANWGVASFWWTDGSAHADHHGIVFHPEYNGSTNQILFNTNDGGIYRTDNARAPVSTGTRAACNPGASGVRWRSLNNGYSVAQFYHGSALPGGHIYLGGLQDNGTVLGSDARGLNRWNKIWGGDGTFAHINPEDPATFYLSTPGLALVRTTDGGATFSGATRGITEPAGGLLFNTPFAVDQREPFRLWTGGVFLWRSVNGAQSWEQAASRLPEGSVSAIAISPHDPNLVLAGTTRGRIHRNEAALTAVATSVWQGSQPRVGFVSAIVFDPVEPTTVYAVYSTFNSDASQAHVYRSQDRGVTWAPLDGRGDSAIPDIPVMTLAIDPTDRNVLYAGTDLGVFVSVDGGASWMKEEGIPYTSVYTLSVLRSGRGAWLYAFTHGRGVWRVPLGQVSNACSYSLDATETVIPPAGDIASVGVDTAADCDWSALLPGDAGSDWISIERGATGRGPGSVQIRVGMTDQDRSGVMSIADKTIVLRQSKGEFKGAGSDEPDTAVEIQSLPYNGYFDTRLATTASSDAIHSCTRLRDSRSVWFRYTPDFTGQIQIAARINLWEVFANARPVVAVYASGTELVCGRNMDTTPNPVDLTTAVTAGVAYLIQVSSAGDAGIGGYLGFAVRRAAAGVDVPRVLHFGDVTVGQSLERVLLVKNIGNAAVEVSDIASDSDAVQVVSAMPVVVPYRTEYPVPGDPSRQVIIRFTARSSGVVESTLTLRTNDPTRPEITVKVTGAGVVR